MPGQAQTVRRMKPTGPLCGRVTAPPSKSVTNRALLLAGLAAGTSRLHHCLVSDDTLHMKKALRSLGIDLQELPDGCLEVTGSAGRPPAGEADLFLGNAGTAMRFLCAAVTLGTGAYRLDGEARMRERPLGDLVRALTELGIQVEYPLQEGYPPVLVSAGPLRGGQVRLHAGRSSQFLSALLMVAPCTARGLEIALDGPVISRPYVDLTLELMDRFGGPAVEETRDGYRVPGGAGYRSTVLEVEGDASSAAALFAAAAVSGGSVEVRGLPANSRQPDLHFVELLARMGCHVVRQENAVEVSGGALHGIHADLAHCPDLTPALAAVGLFAQGSTRITGAPHLRLKESDRIGDLAGELRKLGAQVEEHADGLSIHPGPLRGARLDPHRDHRLAMAFAVVGTVVAGVEIEDPGCVSKSFPGFFEVLDSLMK